MESVGVRELKQRASEIIRRVQETGTPVQVTNHGRLVARIVPVPATAATQAEALVVWVEMDRLALELSRRWPAGVGAAEAVAEQRRSL